MSNTIHPQTRITPKIRQEIKDSGLSDREAAKASTLRVPRQPNGLSATTCRTVPIALIPCVDPEPGQEAIVLSLRQTLYLPLDDLLYITRQYINADVSRSGLAR